MKQSPLPPPWAARVWIADGKMHVDLPAGEDRPSHQLTFPNDMQGMIRLQALLAQRNAHSMIAKPGDLTQHQVNRQLRTKVDITGKPIKKADKFTSEQKSLAKGLLRKLGFIGAVQR